MDKEQFTLITGASAGIGRALAMACAQRKHNLVLVALPQSGLEELASEIEKQFSVKTYAICTDLTNKEAAQEIYQKIKEKNILINVLINNAGMGFEGPFEKYEINFYEKLMQLNINTLTILTRLFIDDLRKQKAAFILNVGSLASFFTVPYKATYSGSKAFVYAFSRALRGELRHSNITVSVLCPAAVDTNEDVMKRTNRAAWLARAGRMSPEEVAKIALKGLYKRKAVIIPGFLNKANLIISKFLPSAIRVNLMANSLRKFHE